MKNDPCEMVNLAESNSAKKTELETILKRYRLAAVPASNLGFDKKADPKLWAGNWASWKDPRVMEYYKKGNVTECNLDLSGLTITNH